MPTQEARHFFGSHSVKGLGMELPNQQENQHPTSAACVQGSTEYANSLCEISEKGLR